MYHDVSRLLRSKAAQDFNERQAKRRRSIWNNWSRFKAECERRDWLNDIRYGERRRRGFPGLPGD